MNDIRDDAGNPLMTQDQVGRKLLSDIHDIKAELDDIRSNMVGRTTLAVFKWVLGGCCTLIAAGFYWAFETQQSRFTRTDGDRQEARHIVLEDRVNRHLISHPDSEIRRKMAEIVTELRHMNRRLDRIESGAGGGSPYP